jgi:23S rRNA pseudouridine2605 synthase
MPERLQKVLSRSGLSSRRGCEAIISEGRVTVNGIIAELGCSVEPGVDEIRVDGKRIQPPARQVYIALNKPVGVISSLRSQDGRPIVRDLVSHPGRIFPVGRLDVESEGLILMTNDGELANILTHPRFGNEKEYRVLLNRSPDTKQLKAWRSGVVLPDGVRLMRASCRVEGTGKDGAWLRIVLRQGRKRQIRETARALGLHVKKVIRIRISELWLGDLRPGEWRFLTKREVALLKKREIAKRSQPSPRKESG